MTGGDGMTKRSVTALFAALAVVLAVFSLAFYLGRSTVPFDVAVDTVKRPAVYDSAALVSDAAVQNSVLSEPGQVDLNAATEQELTMLPGIGPTLAGRIIAYRTQYGRFSAPEQLMDVKGIGQATYDGVKDYLYVEEQP